MVLKDESCLPGRGERVGGGRARQKEQVLEVPEQEDKGGKGGLWRIHGRNVSSLRPE